MNDQKTEFQSNLGAIKKVSTIIKMIFGYLSNHNDKTVKKLGISYDSRYALIMAGGVGSRFWPLSQSKRPKHFLIFWVMARRLFNRLQAVQICLS